MPPRTMCEQPHTPNSVGCISGVTLLPSASSPSPHHVVYFSVSRPFQPPTSSAPRSGVLITPAKYIINLVFSGEPLHMVHCGTTWYISEELESEVL